jgi:RsiW-degrading membrane proteinase PrsW (M82 family)
MDEPLNSNEVPALQQPQQDLIRKQVIRGGWSTSIHALFDDPSRRSSFCALTCCGILLSDRNAHLLQGDRPNWKLRRRLNILLPIVLLLIITGLAASSAPAPTSYQDDDANGGYPKYNPSGSTSSTNDTLVALLRLAFWTIVVGLLIRGKMQRAKLRAAIVERMSAAAQQGENGTTATPSTVLIQGDDINLATGACCCFPNDVTYTLAPATSESDEALMMESLEGQRILAAEGPLPDLCTCMWRAFSNFCCGSLCGCWLQLCGMCAIGQEDREIERLLLHESSEHDKSVFQIDYISFQKFSEYYPLILNLRQAQETGFQAHMKALSTLSRQIIYNFMAYLAMTGIVSVFTGKIMHYAVLLATHAQAIFVLYLIHWKWHKLTVSVDAVIKYFASGFIFSIFMAIIVELVMMVILYPVAIIVFIVEAKEEAGDVPLTSWLANPDNVHEFVKHHMGQLAIVAFVFAFVVAALVEEICKYYGFWTVETPDLTKPDDLTLSGTTPHEYPTLVRRGASITIAMIAVATGFACAENLQFVMGQAKVWDEVTLLIIRSVFPIHQLCAAIQSIGVVKRDLEGNRDFQLGRIIMPAILLHGMYDFVVIFWGLFEVAELDPDDAAYQPPATDEQPPLDFGELVKTLAICCPVMLVAVSYYYFKAEQQRERLNALESVQGSTYSTLRLVEDDDDAQDAPAAIIEEIVELS